MYDLVLLSTGDGEFEALILVPSDWSDHDVENHVSEMTNDVNGHATVDERKRSTMLLRELTLYERK